MYYLHKLLIDATVGDSLMSKSAKDVIVIIERMSLSDQGQYNRNPDQRKNNIIELNTNYEILSHKKLQKVDEFTK